MSDNISLDDKNKTSTVPKAITPAEVVKTSSSSQLLLHSLIIVFIVAIGVSTYFIARLTISLSDLQFKISVLEQSNNENKNCPSDPVLGKFDEYIESISHYSNRRTMTDASTEDSSDEHSQEYLDLSGRIDRLNYLLSKNTMSTTETANNAESKVYGVEDKASIAALTSRIDQLSNQYSILFKSPGGISGGSGSPDISQLTSQFKVLKDEVYQLHSFIVEEVQSLVAQHLEEALAIKDKTYLASLNEQFEKMDIYVVNQLNTQAESIGKQLYAYVDSQAIKLEAVLIDQINTQMNEMNDHVAKVVSSQVLALEEHVRKILVDMMKQYLEKVTKLENRIVRWSLLLQEDASES